MARIDVNVAVDALDLGQLCSLQLELKDYVALVDAEIVNRAQEDADAAVEAKVVEKIWAERPDLKPEYADTPEEVTSEHEWVQPTGVHDAYPPNKWVLHDGVKWQNICEKLNVWEPGADGPVPTWANINATADPKEHGEQLGTKEHPYLWRVGQALKKGEHVTYDGVVYEMQQDHVAVDHYRPGPGLESIYLPA